MCVRGALTEERIYSFLLPKEGAFKTMLGWEEKSQADDMMIRSTLYPHTPLTLPTHTKYPNDVTYSRNIRSAVNGRHRGRGGGGIGAGDVVAPLD